MSSKGDISDKITKIMGSYLLKGYRLLDTYCGKCQTPLMKTKTSDDYCIYCNEINVKTDDKNINTSDVCPMIEDIEENESKTRHQNDIKLNTITNREDIERVAQTVNQKIIWASNQLKSCNQIHDCIQITDFLKSSVELVMTLNKLIQNSKTDK